jgi:nicotinamide-nucleotide amidase
MKKENTVFISLTRSSYEMKLMSMKSYKSGSRIWASHYSSNNFDVRQGESVVAERIEDWENNLECIKLAYLPAPGRVRLRLSRGNR